MCGSVSKSRYKFFVIYYHSLTGGTQNNWCIQRSFKNADFAPSVEISPVSHLSWNTVADVRPSRTTWSNISKLCSKYLGRWSDSASGSCDRTVCTPVGLPLTGTARKSEGHKKSKQVTAAGKQQCTLRVGAAAVAVIIIVITNISIIIAWCSSGRLLEGRTDCAGACFAPAELT